MNKKLFRRIRQSCEASARVFKSTTFTRICATTLFAGAIISLYGALASSATGVASNRRTNLGPEIASTPLSVTVWLKLHNEAALDASLKQMYDKSSSNYHQWLTRDEYKSQFAPSAADAAAVSKYLASHNFTVSSIDQNNHYVIAQGTVGDAATAFNTSINRVMVNGAVHRVGTSAPSVSGPVGALVAAVQGISDLGYLNNIKLATDHDTGIPYAGLPPSTISVDGIVFSDNCLRAPETQTFTTHGGTPKGIYTGNRYGANITNQNPPNIAPCGYDAPEMQKAYGVDALLSNGLDGSGQTIVIVDAFGSNTILADANLFSALNGLPQLKLHQNFQVFRPQGKARCSAGNGCLAGNWNIETTLDVEWAHAMAPKATIALVLGADNSFTNLDIANLFAIENGLGNVLSNSFGIPEIVLAEEAPELLVVENNISKIAAALGVSQQVSTGDAGDNLALDTAAFGIPETSVNANADSPFVTAIGGTSTFLDQEKQIKLQTGWGLNGTRIARAHTNAPTIPPLFLGFEGGAGGGTSRVYHKPSYQSQLPGRHRKVPDISMNADPETGVEIILTLDSVKGDPQGIFVIGGTSLSAPMFSGVWAIANQAAAAQGMGSLGQAAPLLYDLPAGAIIDVDVTSADTQNNVTGKIINPPNPVQHLSADDLAQPEPPTHRYVSALFHSPSSTRWDVFTFGTDSSLATGPGWDNVTGLGTPNGQEFIQAVVTEASGSAASQ